MLYQRPSFSVPSRNLSTVMCVEKGHSGTDSRGSCYACGEKIADGSSERLRAAAPAAALETAEMVGGPLDGASIEVGQLEHVISGQDVVLATIGTQRMYYRQIAPGRYQFDGFAH